MNFVGALEAAASVSFIFGWVALFIALIPSLFVALAVDTRGWQYAIAGLLGGVAGGFCGATSVFLSLWFACRGQVQGCNTAQGDMGLLITFPLGSIVGCLVALLCMRLYSGPRAFRNWAYSITSQIVFWAIVTILFARLMA